MRGARIGCNARRGARGRAMTAYPADADAAVPPLGHMSPPVPLCSRRRHAARRST
ncbi:hypothetical protein DVU_2915 [Nitratidesulfovibrio vulgaris str. Hildenborough]|uniref:Uncharacterized protein n=1 Tax=Nitratidesulfovibrio vulgaris (strain ATCC 29579 / DSM 644 / CCUG 34227 / NCIMB 8303 / VKM B-1760 / Hildenborough) TaxID=882 RepID=Q727E0_NITV2|nr:hypothetical protein DVU_2915 [Nitratidesulfovibrio vulgaris str. Hildenborough]